MCRIRCSKCKILFIQHDVPQVSGNFRKSKAKSHSMAVTMITLFQWKIIPSPPRFMESACVHMCALQRRGRRSKDKQSLKAHRRPLQNAVAMNLNGMIKMIFPKDAH